VDTPSPSAEVRGPSGDAFDLLAIRPAFAVDLAELSERHRALSLSLHPDRFAGQSAAVRRAALHRAVAVNEAHRTLRDPVSRAELLVRRLGLTAPAGPESLEFLEHVMELREALAEASQARDEARLATLMKGAEAERDRALADLVVLLDGPLPIGSSATPSSPPAAVFEQIARLRYATRFLEAARAELDDLS
jgi:molecular chaperone HscB